MVRIPSLGFKFWFAFQRGVRFQVKLSNLDYGLKLGLPGWGFKTR